MDTSSIHKLYLNGDFDQAIEMLEVAQKEKRLHSHTDTVFTYKHLGIMYAAKYETMEKGKGYMYKLLSAEPTAKIMDMYASDMIYMIFKNIQEEFMMTHARPGSAEPKSAVVKNDSVETKPQLKVAERSTWPYWTAGGVALAAGVGVTAFFLMQDNPKDPTHYKAGL